MTSRHFRFLEPPFLLVPRKNRSVVINKQVLTTLIVCGQRLTNLDISRVVTPCWGRYSVGQPSMVFSRLKTINTMDNVDYHL